MSGFFQNLLKDAAGEFFGSDYLRDYTHASKTFRPNAYQYAPKLKFLFHTYFDVNPAAYEFDKDTSTGQNFGLLVRDIKLPSFTIQTAQLNQYNRKRIVQTKIKYDNITISFHDDNSSLATKLWAAYYTYYFKDGTNPQVVFAGNKGSPKGLDLGTSSTFSKSPVVDYNSRTAYTSAVGENPGWGYVGETSVPSISGSPVKEPFFKNVTVFGFHQKNFIAYTLINPIITNFAHDTYNYDEAGGTMKNTMTLDYETVVYNEGSIDGRNPSAIVTGFGDQSTYDRTLSPIAKPGSNATILGQGGLVAAAGGVVGGLSTGSVGGIIGAVQAAGTAYNTFKNVNLKTLIKTEATTLVRNALTQQPNSTRNLQFDFANPASGPGTAGAAGAPTIDAQSQPQELLYDRNTLAALNPPKNAGVQSNTGFTGSETGRSPIDIPDYLRAGGVTG